MSTVNPEDVLAKVSIFSEVKPKELRKLAKEAHILSFDAGTHLTDDGAFGTTYFVILDGTLEVSIHGQAVRTLTPGDSFGEMALVDRDSRSATVVAQTDAQCLVLSRPVFRPFAFSHPEVAWALLELMVKRVRDAESRVPA